MSITASARNNFSKHDAPIAARRATASGRPGGDVAQVFRGVGDNFRSNQKLRALSIALHSFRSGRSIDTIYDSIGKNFNSRDKIPVAREAITSSWRAGSLVNLFDRIGDNVNDRHKLERVRHALDGHHRLFDLGWSPDHDEGRAPGMGTRPSAVLAAPARHPWRPPGICLTARSAPAMGGEPHRGVRLRPGTGITAGPAQRIHEGNAVRISASGSRAPGGSRRSS